jgi:transcriptional regulator of acetoin/glycerol metabolism
MRVEIILPKGMRDYTGPSKPENVSVALEETLALLADRMGILSKLITSLSDQLAQQSQERADAHTDKPSVLQEAVSSNLQQFAIPKPPSDIVESLVETEKRAILNALRRTKWDVRAAARILGIGRTTVYRKLIEYKEQQLARSGGTE